MYSGFFALAIIGLRRDLLKPTIPTRMDVFWICLGMLGVVGNFLFLGLAIMWLIVERLNRRRSSSLSPSLQQGR
jgi:hypothetical protein